MQTVGVMVRGRVQEWHAAMEGKSAGPIEVVEPKWWQVPG